MTYMRNVGLMIVMLMAMITSPPPLIVPQGWAVLTKSDGKEAWRSKDPKGYFEARDDFDGDGTQDIAVLARNEKNKNDFALFVILNKHDKPITITLEHFNDIHDVAISETKRGTFKTACGKGYWVCKPGEPEKLVLTKPALSVSYYGSSDFVYYWNPKTSHFDHVQISD